MAEAKMRKSMRNRARNRAAIDLAFVQEDYYPERELIHDAKIHKANVQRLRAMLDKIEIKQPGSEEYSGMAWQLNAEQRNKTSIDKELLTYRCPKLKSIEIKIDDDMTHEFFTKILNSEDLNQAAKKIRRDDD